MKPVIIAAASAIVVAIAATSGYDGAKRLEAARAPAARPAAVAPIAGPGYHLVSARRSELSSETLDAVIRRTCIGCHNDGLKIGEMSLDSFTVANATKHPELAEKMITKLRAGMMPPPGEDRPKGDTLEVLVATLEQILDRAAASDPNPGARAFQRLNRAEYERSIRDLLTLEVDASKWLPLDTKSANFDNIADVQIPSATLLDSYLDAASEIARLAVGDAGAAITSTTYKLPRLASQIDQAKGAPVGTRGGLAATHIFPADGEYVFAVSLHAIPTGQLFGSTAPFDEMIEISVDGARVATIEVDRGMSQADPNGMELRAKPVQVKAGAHRISAAFVRTFEGPVNDNIAPIGHSIADTQIGAQSGVTVGAHLSDFVVRGPLKVTGISETPSRKRIFICRPKTKAEEKPCADRIIAGIGGAAYRRPVTPAEVKTLSGFYDQGAKEGGFETGVRTALEAILASPHFIFRFEELPENAKPGERHPISDVDLASRLSFFLWGAPPDETLIALAKRGRLSDPAVLRSQTKRMLADDRADALGSRFASQWLRLPDIEKVHPDALQYPDFHEQLADDMREETQQFFMHLVRENRSVLDLYSADYTYLNEALANHYGIRGVVGREFRRVQYPDDRRSGLFGHASILTLTSHANRTSPVLRGKWVMEVMLGVTPPPPPPDVPDIDKVAEHKEGRVLTTRERMEEHRSNPACTSCHLYMDPIGLALDNFDVTGRWRIKENGNPLDTRGMLYDGTPVSNVAELKKGLMTKRVSMVRAFTQNLLAYSIGRRVEHYDMPAVRKIVNDAEAGGYRMQDFITGVVLSDAFRMKRVPAAMAGQQ
ncbi:MAG TPA: DUF1592 domain-containing protein [Gemmatimonadaceae bacterium]|nr:DUF1592 domain-containing protein [Gemmatimonadaceae bacterium]